MLPCATGFILTFMASIYHKGESKTIWIRFQNEGGQWKGKPTAYKWSNFGDVRQAKRLAEKQSKIEAARKTIKTEQFADWVPAWLETKYGHSPTTTPARYRRVWHVVGRFLAERKILTPAQVRREMIDAYVTWRHKTANHNTAIGDLKFLSMVMSEAERRGYCASNPLRRPGLKKAPTKEKEIWTQDAIQKAAAHFEKHGSHWMKCVFYLGLYQACRLRQCAIPLSCFLLDSPVPVIQYPPGVVKGHDGYSHPVDARFLPILKRLIADARVGGKDVLCEIPWDASMRLRKALDRAKLPGYVHHGLRATWITRAAESGVPESLAMAFCHHASREVHRVYKRLSVIGLEHVPAMISIPALS